MGDVIDFPIQRGWDSPYGYVDYEDLAKDKRSAYVFFHDLLVHRPTEYRAFLNLFLAACNSSEEMRQHLTDRQLEATDAMMEAIEQKVPVIKYVASKLKIHKSNASRLLQRVTKVQSATFGELFDNVYRDTFTETPDESIIQQWMFANPRECAGYGRPETKAHGKMVAVCEGLAYRGFALCWDCSQVYGKIYGERPDWLEFKISDIAREHRQNAIEALYRQQKLSVVVDDDYFEVAIAA